MNNDSSLALPEAEIGSLLAEEQKRLAGEHDSGVARLAAVVAEGLRRGYDIVPNPERIAGHDAIVAVMDMYRDAGYKVSYKHPRALPSMLVVEKRKRRRFLRLGKQ